MADIPVLLDRIGWTRKRLAEEVGASEKTIQRWCNLPPSQRERVMSGVAYSATRRYLELVVRILGV